MARQVLNNSATFGVQRAALNANFVELYGGSAINIRHFGAIGNGIANDTAAIADAIAFAKSSNVREVFIPAGTYLTDTITTLESGMTFRGSGEQSVLKSRTGTTVIHLTGATWCAYMKIEDLTIEGFGQVGNSGHGILIGGNADYPRHCTLSKIKILRCGGSGVRGTTPNLFSSILEDIHVEDCGGDLIYFDYLGPASTFFNCYGERPLEGKWCYRVEGGYLKMLSCNGQDNLYNGTFVFLPSRGGYGKFGDTIILNIDSCNIENWSNTAIEIGNNTQTVISNCLWTESIFPSGNPVNTCVALKIGTCTSPVIIQNCKVFSETGFKWGHAIHGGSSSAIQYFGLHGMVGTSMAFDAVTSVPINAIDSIYLGGVEGYVPRFRRAQVDWQPSLNILGRQINSNTGFPPGNYLPGDIVLDTNFASSGFFGIMCTVAGTDTGLTSIRIWPVPGTGTRNVTMTGASPSVNLVDGDSVKTVLITMSGTGTAVVILPPTAAFSGKQITIKRKDSVAAMELYSVGAADPIDNAFGARAMAGLSSITLASDGTAWWVL